MYEFVLSLTALLQKMLVGSFSYSGFRKFPMYGDYEAQRHWMEITYNLPIKQWYQNGTNNDLQYWGLDYPPLTAYHSYLCGYISHEINSSWVELFTSRGFESKQHKLFMRLTVICSDLLIFIPAVFTYFKHCCQSKVNHLWLCAVMLFYPGLILIDHGHFQYNCVSLGLALWAVIGIHQGRDLWASFAFVLALNFKQMELYHALPFFVYLFSTSIRHQKPLLKLVKLAVVVLVTFALCWFPFLTTNTWQHVLQRVFPVDRGLFEDKVANVWVLMDLVIKLRKIFSKQELLKISLLMTSVASGWFCLKLFLKPTKIKFNIALVISSLAFFLFSYQVHEKSILLVAMPVLLLWPEAPFLCSWFLHITTFSMLPLFIKDGLVVPYFALSFIFFLVTRLTASDTNNKERVPSLAKLVCAVSLLSVLGLSVAALTVAPPPKYPDLWPLVISVFSCFHFALFFLFLNVALSLSSLNIMRPSLLVTSKPSSTHEESPAAAPTETQVRQTRARQYVVQSRSQQQRKKAQ